MKLSALIKKLESEIVEIPHPNKREVCKNDYEIKSIHSNSDNVKEGGLFIAIKGFKADGHNYIKEAVKKGAKAIISEKKVKNCQVPVIIVKNSRKILSGISASFFNNPSEHLFLIGVTGTNGKTTVTYLIENILNAAGKTTGVIGTVNIRYAGAEFINSVTTPESYHLQKTLFEMKKNRVTHVVMEVSSHAIDLFRIEDCLFNAVVLTNLTQDHLDYHKDMATYWDCKKSLFTKHIIKGCKKNKAVSVINTDNQYGKQLYQTVVTKKISVGSDDDNFIRAESVEYKITGIKAVLKIGEKKFKLKSPLIGEHNLQNILCAAGACIAAGISGENITKGIENTKNIPGRLEKVRNNAKKNIFVDYAHTPDALKNVLLTLKKLKPQKLITVFGCGGGRDKTKRSIMGKIAGKLSDLCIITSDNPRSEDPNKIIEQIIKGVKTETDNFIIEPDRKKGIKAGIKALSNEDILIIAGKGHETYQIIKNKKLNFDDRKTVKQIINL
ncbi:MAG: UDP-N-acetylmuramoyl-L-alanyl-D-glutamate--2,6-diaminopimelate ligase [Deltaproteobacteria bacterium]|nr:UDP-N-acetylmuramoyl-L-alanyl-D-glutamate--2,6-diaminopimelate ligase [Deltaproteobacteria bacterium]